MSNVIGLADRVKMMVAETTRDALSTAIPLFPDVPDADPFPVDAMGALAKPAAAIARKVQAPESMAANAVLATAALAAQGHADVELPGQGTRPLSLFFITIAESGDRKSGVDREALAAVKEVERDLDREKDEADLIYGAELEAWNAARRNIVGKKGEVDRAAMAARLLALGPEPDRPLDPLLVFGDASIDGLVKNMPRYHASLGLFTDEAGVLIGGYAMGKDHALRSAALLSHAWDGAPLKRVRADKDERTTIARGRRLSCHFMAQPDAALGFIQNPVLRDQGLLARYLIAYPSSLAGTRLVREPDSDDIAAIGSLNVHLRRLLRERLPLVNGTQNELSPPAIRMSGQAKQAWVEFSNAVELAQGEDMIYRPIKPLASKAAELAARIAGVLTVYEGQTNGQSVGTLEISLAAMENAIRLMTWYMREALRIQGQAIIDTDLRIAAKVLNWAKRRKTFSLRDLIRQGPADARLKKVAERCLEILKDHGHLAEDKGTYRFIG